MTAPTINAALADLARLHIIEEVTGRKRGRVFAYRAYLDVIGRRGRQREFNVLKFNWIEENSIVAKDIYSLRSGIFSHAGARIAIESLGDAQRPSRTAGTAVLIAALAMDVRSWCC